MGFGFVVNLFPSLFPDSTRPSSDKQKIINQKTLNSPCENNVQNGLEEGSMTTPIETADQALNVEEGTNSSKNKYSMNNDNFTLFTPYPASLFSSSSSTDTLSRCADSQSVFSSCEQKDHDCQFTSFSSSKQSEFPNYGLLNTSKYKYTKLQQYPFEIPPAPLLPDYTIDFENSTSENKEHNNNNIIISTKELLSYILPPATNSITTITLTDNDKHTKKSFELIKLKQDKSRLCLSFSEGDLSQVHELLTNGNNEVSKKERFDILNNDKLLVITNGLFIIRDLPVEIKPGSYEVCQVEEVIGGHDDNIDFLNYDSKDKDFDGNVDHTFIERIRELLDNAPFLSNIIGNKLFPQQPIRGYCHKSLQTETNYQLQSGLYSTALNNFNTNYRGFNVTNSGDARDIYYGVSLPECPAASCIYEGFNDKEPKLKLEGNPYPRLKYEYPPQDSVYCIMTETSNLKKNNANSLSKNIERQSNKRKTRVKSLLKRLKSKDVKTLDNNSSDGSTSCGTLFKEDGDSNKGLCSQHVRSGHSNNDDELGRPHSGFILNFENNLVFE